MAEPTKKQLMQMIADNQKNFIENQKKTDEKFAEMQKVILSNQN